MAIPQGYALTLPVVVGKNRLKNYRLFTRHNGQGRELYRVMDGDRWVDDHLRTLSECMALVEQAAADALGADRDAAPEWPAGTPVRAELPGVLSAVGGTRSAPSCAVSTSTTPRTTLTRTTCRPFTRDGVHLVRVAGYAGEVACSDVEVVS